MEKLIELLNEYRTEKGERNLNEFEVSQTLDSLNYLRLFIKWLVENDKIVNFRIDRKIIDSWWLYHWKETTINRVWNNLDKVLIVLLSISENPISDLITYLK